MEHFIARQPIFDQKGKVYAYELLFRSGLHNYFDAADQDQAAASVIANIAWACPAVGSTSSTCSR